MHEDDLPLDDSSFHEADYEDNEFEDGDFDDASFEDDGFEDAADFDALDSSSLDDSVMRELAVNDDNSVDEETTNDFVDSTDHADTDNAHADAADDDDSAEAEETDEELLADDSRPSPQLWSEDVEIPAAATPIVDEPETPAPAAAIRQEGQPFVRKTKARELALQMLFQADLNPESSEQDIADQLRDRLPKADLFQFAWDLYRGVVRDQELLDRDIAATATNWRVSRMAATDRNVLRLGAYELQHMDTPYGVVLDEAIDLAKKFGTSQSASFVNGVLDKLVPEAKRPTGASTSHRPNDDSQDAAESPVREPVARGTSAAVGDNVIPANASPEDVAKHSPEKPIAFKRKQVDLTESRPDAGEDDQ